MHVHKAGCVAPADFVIPPSNTSFFQALNIPTKMSKGAVDIIQGVDLAKLNIKPFTYGLEIQKIYDDSGSIYGPEVLDITEDDVAERFAIAVSNLFALAMSISYPSLTVAPRLIINGYNNLLATHCSFSLPPHLNQYHKAAPAPAPSSPKASAPVEEQGMSSDILEKKSKVRQAIKLEEATKEQSQVASLPRIEDVASEEKDETPDNQLLVQPMYQIFSISINLDDLRKCTYPKMYKVISSSKDGVPCQIIGLVRLFVQNGKPVDIYHRSNDNPEVVRFGGFLSISGSPILQLGAIKVAVYLFDLAHNIEIANEIIHVLCNSTSDYDRVHVTEATGAHGFACIHHSIFQHAVSAGIESMVLTRVGGSGIDEPHAQLYGTVSAYLERSYPIFTSDAEEFPALMLFDNRNTTNSVHFGSEIALFRTCVVVPAFCSLKIKATFNDESGRDVSTDTKLNIINECSTEKCSKGPNCEMKLAVKWSSMQETAATQPKLQVSGAKELPAKIACAKPMVSPCVEVFSILLFMEKDSADVSGSVEIGDSSHVFSVFNDEQTWYHGETLNLKAPLFSFDDEPFKINISLVDEEKCVVSRGSFRWDCSDDDGCALMLHDRFLCSVVKGDIGYAAVHYEMITHAVEATIQVFIKSQCIPNSIVKVHGSINAQYGKYYNSCPYNQEYFRSTLFCKAENEAFQVEIGLRSYNRPLPLTKSLVAVPLDDVLIVNLGLKINGPGLKVREFEKSMEFKTDGGSTGMIHTDDYSIYVDAGWNYVRQLSGSKI